MGHKGQIRRKYAPPPSKYAPDKIRNSTYVSTLDEKKALMEAQEQTPKLVSLQLNKIYCPFSYLLCPRDGKKYRWGADFFCKEPVIILLGVMCQLGRNGPIFSHDGQKKGGSTLEEH